MTTLYLDRKGLELRLDGAALALYENGSRFRTVPLAMLKRVVIRAETTLSSSVLGALAEGGCATIVLSGRHGRRLAVIHGRAHNDAALRVAQYGRVQDPAWRLKWAARFVAAKLGRQQRFLERARAARPDRGKPIFDALESLRPLRIRAAGSTSSTSSTSSIESLRGIEGAAQAAYFRAFTTLFPESLNFRTRNRRPPRDPVNACLSLGYTLVHFEAERAAHVAGLDPFLGFLHELAFGRASLACDLIEPVRPLVDAWVWEMFRTRALRPEHFTTDKGACLLEKTGRLRYYEHFEPFLKAAGKRLGAYCRLLARELRSDQMWVKAGVDVDTEDEL